MQLAMLQHSVCSNRIVSAAENNRMYPMQPVLLQHYSPNGTEVCFEMANKGTCQRMKKFGK